MSESPRVVRRVGVIGAGTMGSGIAASFAQAGFEVLLIDSMESALASGLERVRKIIDGGASRGLYSGETAAAARARVHGSGELAAVRDADLVIEAVFEDLALKRDLFRRLGGICKSGCVLATNTSSLDVAAIAAASGRAGDVIGMHFFSPAHVMRLVEIVRAPASGPAGIATALAVAEGLGKVGVVVGNGFGFAGNRMFYAYGREKEFMLLEGAAPAQIDRALESFGMAMGPNAVGDLAGLDIGAGVRRAWKDRPVDPRWYRATDLLVERGRLGRKTGRGFYRYDDGRRGDDAEVPVLIRAEAARLGVPQREIPETEIVERCIFALVNEGARILAEGIARSAADLDLIWCHGYGFPHTRGGPMSYADTIGLPAVLATIEKYRHGIAARYWMPAPLLRDLAESGRRLADWRRPEAEP